MTGPPHPLAHAGLATIHPQMSFDEACTAVLDHLKVTIPLGLWMVAFYDPELDRQVFVHLRDDVYGLEQGQSTSWTDSSLCQYVVTGAAPQIAPDAMSVPLYAGAGAVRAHDIGAYVGIPIHAGSGRLYGTICGLDPAIQPDSMREHAPELALLADLLGQILTRQRVGSEAAARQAAMVWRSMHDELTGLPSRAYLSERLSHKLGLRHGDFRPLAVLILDIDDFKAVNATFGRALGDQLLAAVAERLRLVLPAGDSVARMAADEFAVMVERDDLAEYRHPPSVVAERLVAALSEPFELAGELVRVSVSVGVAPVEPADRSFSAGALLARAEVALHAAKGLGRGRVALHRSALRLPQSRDLELEEPLRHAIADRTVDAAFQPIVELATGKLTSVECLARWQCSGVPISPEVFVPLAMRSGQLGTLTDLMLDQGCGQLAEWPTAGGREPRLAVHVPAPLLTDTSFPARVLALVGRHGLQPSRLTLQVTEDAVLSDLEAALRVCDQLREAGVALSLDDFGTGHSSLQHLEAFKLDSVKINRAFTNAVDSSPIARRFVANLVARGRDRDLDVVVEGIERSSQARALVGLGATHAQGYLFGRPVPGDELDLSRLLAERIVA